MVQVRFYRAQSIFALSRGAFRTSQEIPERHVLITRRFPGPIRPREFLKASADLLLEITRH